MRNRRVGKILYILIICSLLVSSFWLSALILRAVAPVEAEALRAAPKTSTPAITPPARINLPARLEIAALTVSTIVKPVGMTVEGDMAIDDNINEVAWYEPGPRPGETGSAVIAGHYGWIQGQPAVFNNLHTLAAGDKVSVYDANNQPVSFIVQRIQSYDPASDATSVFVSSDGKAHLNLITCEGSWNSSQQTYSERLVVFTDKEL